jgi:hypothetical protein
MDGTTYQPSDAATCSVAGNADAPCFGMSAL